MASFDTHLNELVNELYNLFFSLCWKETILANTVSIKILIEVFSFLV